MAEEQKGQESGWEWGGQEQLRKRRKEERRGRGKGGQRWRVIREREVGGEEGGTKVGREELRRPKRVRGLMSWEEEGPRNRWEGKEKEKGDRRAISLRANQCPKEVERGDGEGEEEKRAGGKRGGRG